MKHTILDAAYEAVFIDTEDYPPSTPFLLRGLAAVVQDSHPEWRPRVSELADLLQRLTDFVPLLNAGAAYGAGKQIMYAYPGPATLLFGAALNAVGEMPNVELAQHVAACKEIFRGAKLADNDHVRAVLRAAQERAGFDRVTMMLKQEFADGLRRSGTYSEQQINDLVPKIVNTTHDTRHRALISRQAWGVAPNTGGRYTMDTNTLTEADEVASIFAKRPKGDNLFFGNAPLGSVVKAAQVGCSFALVHRVEALQSVATK